jgi:hypothetical protein
MHVINVFGCLVQKVVGVIGGILNRSTSSACGIRKSNLFSLVSQNVLAKHFGAMQQFCDHQWTVKGQALTPNTWYQCIKCGKTRPRG